MLQHLLNTTAIWLISLVLFDIFLRRESYHGYNRFYLLFTFLLGALLPLWEWGGKSTVYELPAVIPVRAITETRHSIVAAATASSLFDHINWWWLAYAAGVFVAAIILATDIFNLIRLYRGGTITYEDGLKIIETGSQHTPFSFLKIVFVESREKYNALEWQTVLAHERRHATLGHLADVLLMQLAKVVFWFHPLVYLYNRRLLTVHEYQADRESAIQPQHYGQFLIEQALLHRSPVITHSFNRSPIKSRIQMLTRRSGVIAKFKTLVFLPLVLVSFICFSQKMITKTFKADEYGFVKLGNNQFEFTKMVMDTVELEEMNGTVVRRIVRQDPHPIKVDGKVIEDARPVFKDNSSFDEYIYKKMTAVLSKLSDGTYYLGISNLIVDDKGKTCAFTFDGILSDNLDPAKQRERRPVKIDKQLEQRIFNGMCNELSSVTDWHPPVINGKKVVCVSNLFGNRNYYPLKVQTHKLYVQEDARNNTWREL